MADKIYLIIALVLLFGLLLVGIGIRRLFGRNKLGGGISVAFGIVLVATAVGSVGVIANLYTYHRVLSNNVRVERPRVLFGQSHHS